MAYYADLRHARLRAIRAASSELDRLEIDKTRQIPIFDIIERQDRDLLLDFQPLGRRLYGAYLNGGSTRVSGIVVHRRHPVYLQRSTAAHEYGHHVLGHASVSDGEEQIEPQSPSTTIEEVEAQAFAGYFLMPYQLVFTTLRRKGWPDQRDTLSAAQLYQLSLECGVNYRAVLTHCETLGLLTPAHARNLRGERQMQLKADLLDNVPAPDSWSNVWLLGARDSGAHILPRVDDVIRLDLEGPVADMWAVQIDSITRVPTGTQHIALVADHGSPVIPARYAEERVARSLFFRALQPGLCRLRVVRDRPSANAPMAIFDATLSVQSRNWVLPE